MVVWLKLCQASKLWAIIGEENEFDSLTKERITKDEIMKQDLRTDQIVSGVNKCEGKLVEL